MVLIDILVSLVFAFAANADLCGTPCNLFTLKWSDEFSGSAVDTSTWYFRTDKKDLSAQLASNVAEGDGTLIINLKKQTVGGYNYTGGGVVSKPNFHYGYYEARMEINDGAGWHTSFWLMAGNGATTYNSATGTYSEIDVHEINSISPTQIKHSIFFWGPDGAAGGNIISATKTPGEDFRDYTTFGALWTEDRVLYYVNGVLDENSTFGPSTWTHDYKNIWLSSIAYQDQPDDSKLPSQVRVGDVRYYQKDYYLTAGTLCFSRSQGSTPCPSNSGYAESGPGWAQSSIAGYTKNLVTRYACQSSSSSASWTLPSTVTAGTYTISAWIVAQSNSDPNAAYDVLNASGTKIQSTMHVDQTSGSSRWVTIASAVQIAAGAQYKVRVTGSGTNCVRADAVKFVRTA